MDIYSYHEGEMKKEGLRPSYTPQKIGFLYLRRGGRDFREGLHPSLT